MSKIEKAYAITDAKISFVSLVDKAANKKQFLITKAEHGSASFASYGRILNADADSHYITGIVYEPLTEDAHGNYMTEQEITKAAYWFAKNGNQVDVQHSFEPLEKAAVVESYVAPCDMSVGEQAIKKGTWMMTVEVDDPDIFEKVQKGEITGFSMGGVGKYSVCAASSRRWPLPSALMLSRKAKLPTTTSSAARATTSGPRSTRSTTFCTGTTG